ncbi:hypothetical protein APHAL10511_004499 [Amanita phalloides]|nr:hypothetical protein APHAL10511_004499 [Amanita phalloides]
MSIAAAITRLNSRLSSLELVHSPHPSWPLPPSHPPARPLAIAVLDSSFNPPTLAHLALANALRPRALANYDARLLLLSVLNADKTFKPGDATYVERVEMMHLLSHDITRTPDNVAVAIINEPTFVGKSKVLLSFLRQRLQVVANSDNNGYCPSVQLSFILGFDTLERLVAPRYYGSAEQMLLVLRRFFSPAPEGDDSYVVCARRGDTSLKIETERSKSDPSDLQHAREFLGSDRIVMIDIGAEESMVSSTAVRSAIGSGDPSWKTYVPNSIAQYIIQNRLYTKA